jgi:hypothetical protein
MILGAYVRAGLAVGIFSQPPIGGGPSAPAVGVVGPPDAESSDAAPDTPPIAGDDPANVQRLFLAAAAALKRVGRPAPKHPTPAQLLSRVSLSQDMDGAQKYCIHGGP